MNEKVSAVLSFLDILEDHDVSNSGIGDFLFAFGACIMVFGIYFKTRKEVKT